MQIDLFNVFTASGVSPEKARDAERQLEREIMAEIDRRYEVHAKQLFTRGDGAEMESRLLKAINETQCWTLTALVSGMAIVAAIHKLL
jgi:hypothetical protein